MQELLGNLGIDWRLFTAQAINFLLVLWLLNKFVFKKIILHLEERKEKIAKGLELSEKAKEEIERINQARIREINKAKEEGEKIISESRTSANEKEKASLLLAKEEAGKILLKAKNDAEKEKKDTLAGAKNDIKALAIMIAEKLLKRSTDEKDQEESAKEVLEHFQNKYAK